MKYAVYYRTPESTDKNWKRSCETYKNRKGLLTSRPRVFSTIEDATSYCTKVQNDHGYETKIKEL